MLPLVSCVMSHFEEIELSSEHLNNWRMNVHLEGLVVLTLLVCGQDAAIEIDSPDGVTPHIQVNVRCSIFNEIRPILDWSSLNNGRWLIRTQTWAFSAKD